MSDYDPNRGAPDGCLLIVGVLGYALFGLLVIGVGIVIVGQLVW